MPRTKVGFLDLEGNARLVFDGVFIERLVSSKPPAERRELKSLFKPKSAQVLRVMLRDPSRAWRVTELAESAGVSLGHVSNVRSGLLDREWAQVSDHGLFLSEPDALLDAWRDAYEPPAGKRMGFYTTLHGSAFEEAARRTLHAGPEKGQAVFASFSAAHWLAPYGRTGTQYFYADDAGLERLKIAFEACPRPQRRECRGHASRKTTGCSAIPSNRHRGVVCTSPVQTYLDLAAAGERGREAAEHLRQERLIMADVTPPEPQSAADYDDRTTAAVKSVLIEIGQILGSFRGKFAVIGGAVPWLLLDNEEMPHVGSLDVDLSLDAEALGDGEYATLVEALNGHGYEQREELRRFQLVRQVPAKDGGPPIDIIVDFLMPRDAEIVKNTPPLVADFAVQRADGADLALRFYQLVAIDGPMPDGGTNRVEIAVCSIPALLAMKGHALHGRLKQKDAYDIYYCIRNYPDGIDALAEACRPMLERERRTGLSLYRGEVRDGRGFGPTCVRHFVEDTEILGVARRNNGNKTLLAKSMPGCVRWAPRLIPYEAPRRTL